MDFLTTNFNHEEITSNFYAPFRLMDLPLEILFKILIFLDDPDLRSLSFTCHYLKRVATERFISRSKFFYVQQKIGISLQIRPSTQSLYDKHILPTPLVSSARTFNIRQFILSSNLQKSFRRDSLSKELNRRPTKEELKEKNILVQRETSELVNNRLKEFKKQQVSQVFEVFIKSHKFQSKKGFTDSNVKEKVDHLTEDIMNDRPVEVTDEFTAVYLKFCERLRRVSKGTFFGSSNILPDPNRGSTNDQAHKTFGFKINQVLNHIEKDMVGARDLDNLDLEKIFEDELSAGSKVKSKKKYFENLATLENSDKRGMAPRSKSASSVSNCSSSDDASVTVQKPSRTVLKASVVNDSINYEKMF